MITEDYVSLETAKLLKEKGFEVPSFKPDEWSFCMYDEEGKLQWGVYSDDWYCRITLQMAMKWLREAHKIHVEIRITNHSLSPKYDVPKYYWVLFDAEKVKWMDESTMHDSMSFKTYEEACEAGIKYCLEKMI